MSTAARWCRSVSICIIFAGAAFVVLSRPADAQETKCYLMVCTGSTCIATQIPCPKSDIVEKPAT